jgi:glyoxylase-like metal-dependent hydrolase (beta-lactamase superfamily II)
MKISGHAPCRPRDIPAPLLRILALLPLAAAAMPAQTASPVEFFRLVPGFLAENKNAEGAPMGTGFAAPNPWGAYTAYLLATNNKGQRTWRIENYPPSANPAGLANGSTMYLLEGSERALLIDTANNTPETMGQNDLKTVVRHLLSHTNDGAPGSNPLDFVVAITHGHGDHTGKNAQMSDRAIYFPDLDWPNNATPNYVPVKEGGGATAHGAAAAEIALGARTLRPIAVYGHTRGSTAYLDTENNMIFTGDAIGSGYAWMHFGPITQYVESVRHLQAVLRPLNNPAILPGHFYQITAAKRGKPPINGRMLDKQYVDDQLAAAEGVLNGAVIGEPYRTVNRNTVIAEVNSAGMSYTFARIYPEGAGSGVYRAVRIAGPAGAPPATGSMIDKIGNTFYLIREGSDHSLYLLKTSAKALLIGTGSGTPGLAAFVARLAGSVPLEVVATSDDTGQIGGLRQFAKNRIYLPKGAPIPRTGLEDAVEIAGGATIDLGNNSAGKPVTLQVDALTGHSPYGLTLLDESDRILFSGDALGAQAPDAGLILHDPPAQFAAAFAVWRKRTDMKYDIVYTSRNYQWLTSPSFVDQLQAALNRAIAEGPAAFTDSAAMPGHRLLKSPGGPDIVASIVQ